MDLTGPDWLGIQGEVLRGWSGSGGRSRAGFKPHCLVICCGFLFQVPLMVWWDCCLRNCHDYFYYQGNSQLNLFCSRYVLACLSCSDWGGNQEPVPTPAPKTDMSMPILWEMKPVGQHRRWDYWLLLFPFIMQEWIAPWQTISVLWSGVVSIIPDWDSSPSSGLSREAKKFIPSICSFLSLFIFIASKNRHGLGTWLNPASTATKLSSPEKPINPASCFRFGRAGVRLVELPVPGIFRCQMDAWMMPDWFSFVIRLTNETDLSRNNITDQTTGPH